jgi:YVTN family beta-propeller protein
MSQKAEAAFLVRAVLVIAMALWPAVAEAQQTSDAPLAFERKIPLGEVSGRIDHLALDSKRQRLFVAELGNNSLGVIDVATGKVLRRITGLSEPQGVAYFSFADSVYVANAGDGSVRVFGGDDLASIGRIELGDDADNVRVDTQRNRVLVGYGKGALAVIDPASRAKLADIRLKAHPESFQIDETGTRVFVNVPDARDVEIVDLTTGSVRSVPTEGAGSNFPMAIDAEVHRVLIVFRSPPTLMALSSEDGHLVAKAETCGDADDVFVDGKRRRVYVSCGEGVMDVLEPAEAGYRRLGHLGNLTAEVRTLRRPIAKRRPKPVCRKIAAVHAAQRHRHGHVGERAPRPDAGKDVIALRSLPHPLKNSQRRIR